MQWQDVVARLRQDEGAFLDIVVVAGEGGWQRLLDLPRRKGWRYRYTEDAEAKPVPTADEIASRRAAIACRYEFEPLPGLEIATAFSEGPDLELWFDPRAIDSAQLLDALYGFLRALGRDLGADVAVSLESHPEWTYLRYDHTTDAVIEVDG